MRTIKFRLYDTKRKEWVHDTDHAVNLFGEIIMFGEMLRRPDDTHVDLKDLNNIVAMQYTGLLDKSGKEIYEGDLVAFNNRGVRQGEVKWADDDCSFMLVNIVEPYQNQYDQWLTQYLDNLEVVGNIYETKS